MPVRRVTLLLRRSATQKPTEPHVTYLVRFLRTGNHLPTNLVPSIHDIDEIANLLTPENAIIMAREEIAYLDDMSLEGDVPDDVSDIVEVHKKALFNTS